ncbi:MAG: hypothetical protein FJ248_04380 [Nitrospira sp.]|nr:hypothetical protein [Nitrospira sp.]
MKIPVPRCQGSEQVCVEEGAPLRRRTFWLLINGMAVVNSRALAVSWRLQAHSAIRPVRRSLVLFDHIQGLLGRGITRGTMRQKNQAVEI